MVLAMPGGGACSACYKMCWKISGSPPPDSISVGSGFCQFQQGWHKLCQQTRCLPWEDTMLHQQAWTVLIFFCLRVVPSSSCCTGPPSEIVNRLVSYDNPGRNDYQQQARADRSVAQLDVLAHTLGDQEKTPHNSSDNVAMVWWQRKRAVSSLVHTSCLLRIKAEPCIIITSNMYLSTTPSGGGETLYDDCSKLCHSIACSL
jgi:hypothetical protein